MHSPKNWLGGFSFRGQNSVTILTMLPQKQRLQVNCSDEGSSYSVPLKIRLRGAWERSPAIFRAQERRSPAFPLTLTTGVSCFPATVWGNL